MKHYIALIYRSGDRFYVTSAPREKLSDFKNRIYSQGWLADGYNITFHEYNPALL